MSRLVLLKDSTSNHRSVVESLRECWNIVGETPKDPESLARVALAKGDYVNAEFILRPSMLSFDVKGCGPYIQTLYLYILEYHVFHWRNKRKTSLRELQLIPNLRKAFEQAYHDNDAAWQPISILAYIHLKVGNPRRCDALLYEALKCVNTHALPYIIQSLLYMQWVPPKPPQMLHSDIAFRLEAPKLVGSRDIDSAERLLLHAIKLDKRVVAAHKILGLLQLQYRGDIEEAQDLFSYALTHRKDPDALWWSHEISKFIGYKKESQRYMKEALNGDPACASKNYHIQGPHGGKAWLFKKFVRESEK